MKQAYSLVKLSDEVEARKDDFKSTIIHRFFRKAVDLRLRVIAGSEQTFR